MTIGWPRPADILVVTMRASASAGPPGDQGLTTLIGLVGYCCADAAADRARVATKKSSLFMFAPGRSKIGQARAELGLDDLAQRIAREIVDDEYLLRHFVRRELLAAEAAQVSRVHRETFLENHE